MSGHTCLTQSFKCGELQCNTDLPNSVQQENSFLINLLASKKSDKHVFHTCFANVRFFCILEMKEWTPFLKFCFRIILIDICLITSSLFPKILQKLGSHCKPLNQFWQGSMTRTHSTNDQLIPTCRRQLMHLRSVSWNPPLPHPVHGMGMRACPYSEEKSVLKLYEHTLYNNDRT